MKDEFVLFSMSWIDEATDSTDSPSNVDLERAPVGAADSSLVRLFPSA